ncbi:MAG: alpha/beta hydrolase fold domain-containing protein [Phycisphaerales bacterium]|nr:alpha/beta hydrolase fold domain-containing protein [Phycisphaerales bacterium]
MIEAYPPASTVLEHRAATIDFEPVVNCALPGPVGRVHEHIRLQPLGSGVTVHGRGVEDAGASMRAALMMAAAADRPELALMCPARPVVRVVEPDSERFRRPWPVLIFVHGGGWVTGSLRSYAALISSFAARGFLTLAPAYRLAPEHVYPAAELDVLSCVRFAQQHAASFGGDAARMVLAGDSAGAQICAGVIARLAAKSDESNEAGDIRAAAVLYAVADLRSLETPELHGIRRMRDWYLGEGRCGDRGVIEQASPVMHARTMPPTVVVAAGEDALRGQSLAYGAALRAASVEHELIDVPDVPHGFLQCGLWPETSRTLDRVKAFLLEAAS